MRQLSLHWSMLDPRRKALLLGGAAAILVMLAILSRVATAPRFDLLYAGLEPAAAAEIVSALEARGVPYSVRGDAIFVDRAQRDELRMSLAGDGLPANGAAGYELLDSLSGFGTTSQMFDAAYWRAKEGELARTISASSRVQAARVHLANPTQDPFRDRAEVTASVAVRPASGAISSGHARALRYLVASSVPGLLPEQVTVVDADSGRILSADALDLPGADAQGRADALRRNIERLLAARVGPGNAVVEVSVELNTAHETILERRIDPDSRVVIATDTEERATQSQEGAAGAVTVASNLPDGDAGDGAAGAASQNSETRERVTFDVSETQRELAREPGSLRRISVAVLVNGVVVQTESGETALQPRDAEELAALERLVQSAIGFDAERGDQVTLRSMVFEELPPVGGDMVASPGIWAEVDLAQVLQTLAVSVVILVVAFGVVRPALRAPAGAAAPLAVGATSAAEGPVPDPLGPSGHGNGSGSPALSAPSALAAIGADRAPSVTPPALLAAPGAPDPVDRLRRLIEEREDETVEILRSWMDEDDEEPA